MYIGGGYPRRRVLKPSSLSHFALQLRHAPIRMCSLFLAADFGRYVLIGSLPFILTQVIWTALTAEGLGASLQHYFTFNQEIPKAISKAFDVPTSWKCTAIMPVCVTNISSTPLRPS